MKFSTRQGPPQLRAGREVSMDEQTRLRHALALAQAESDYYRNLVLLDEYNPQTTTALAQSQDRLQRLEAGVIAPSRSATMHRRGWARWQYLLMIPVNILVAIPVSIVAAVAFARMMSSSIWQKGLLDILVRNTSQTVRITVDQQQSGKGTG